VGCRGGLQTDRVDLCVQKVTLGAVADSQDDPTGCGLKGKVCKFL
jgi:hypothetical protein